MNAVHQGKEKKKRGWVKVCFTTARSASSRHETQQRRRRQQQQQEEHEEQEQEQEKSQGCPDTKTKGDCGRLETEPSN